MTRNDISERLADRAGIERKAARAIVDHVVDILFDAFAGGENVYLRGFGTFSLRHRSAKTARNINTGAPVEVPAWTTVNFKPSPVLRTSLNVEQSDR